MKINTNNTFQIIVLWFFLICVNLLIRPLMPIDETRYVTVAWEMWLNNDFLVPHLNGETYSHKPPFLFWLMQSSWFVFGLNDWTPRLISPLFALASTLLSGVIAQKLWRERPQIAELTPFILLGFSIWLIFSTLTMFDMLLAFFVLLAIYSVLNLSESHQWRDVFLLGIAIAGGVFSKGPVVLLQILPVALLAPWWLKTQNVNFWFSWYSKLVIAILIGASLALAWAIPAGISGGEAYRNAIFLGQTSGRLVKSFAHQLPWYWYLERLPLFLLPWLFLKPLWQGVLKLNLTDVGVRFCIAWALPVLVMFSLVSGKRIHYLLPLMPAFALLLARAADEIQNVQQWKNASRGLWLFFGLLAMVLMTFPVLNENYHWHEDLKGLNPLWGAALALTVISVIKINQVTLKRLFVSICFLSISTTTLIAASYLTLNFDRFDTQPIAQKIAQFQTDNMPIAFYTQKYHGQFQFTGRLKKPLVLLDSLENVAIWSKQNSNGFILLDSKKLPRETLLYWHAYRAGELGFIQSKQLLNNLKMLEN